ncbi:hypothetical protein QCQ60_005605 [Bacillus cereus]|nr:hypothetical protein [Bacillus cereus]
MNRILESSIQALKQLREPILFVLLTGVACFGSYRSIQTLSFVPSEFFDLVPFSLTNTATHIEGMLFSFLAGTLFVLLSLSLIHLICTEIDEYTILGNSLFVFIGIAFMIVGLYFLVLAIYLLCALLVICLVVFLWINNGNKR